MNFLSNIFNRIFGRKQEEEEETKSQGLVKASPSPSRPVAPVAQPSPSQQPQVQPVRAPEINPATLEKAPEAPEQQGLLGKVKNFFDPGSDNFFWRGVEKASDFIERTPSVRTARDYGQNMIVDPLASGVAKISLAKDLNTQGSRFGTAKNVGSGLLDAAIGAFNATPAGAAFNTINSSATSALQKARGEGDFGENFQKNIVKPTSFAQEGLGIDNPALALGIDLITANPRGSIAGIRNLGELRNARSLGGVSSNVIQSVKDILGFNPETASFQNLNKDVADVTRTIRAAKDKVLEIVPGVRSANPAKIQQADEVVSSIINPVATLTPPVENPSAGQLNNPYGNKTIEDAMLEVPAYQRNQEAALNRLSELRKVGDGQVRTMTDIDPVLRNAQDLDFAPPASSPAIDVRGIGQDIRPPLEKVQPTVPVATEEEIAARLRDANKERSLKNTNEYRQKVLSGELENLRFGGDEPITVFRASADGPVKPGDFVTTSEEAARKYQQQRPGSQIETITAPQSSFVRASGLQNEMVYAPRAASDGGQIASASPVDPVQPDIVSPAVPRTAPVEALEVPSPQPTQVSGDVAAPRLREALVDSLQDAEKVVPSDSTNREALVIKEVMERARGMVNDMDGQDLVRMYTEGISPESLQTLVRTPRQYAFADASLRKLYELARQGDQGAVTAADNILSAMQYGSSGSGQFLRITQQAFDDMPIPMKINRVIGYIERANAQKFGPDSLEVADLKNPARRAVIEKQLDGMFTVDQAIRDDIASADNALEAIKANPSAYSEQDVRQAGNALEQATARLSKNTEEFAKFYEGLVPGSGDAIDKIGNYQRTAMLSSIAGRVQDVLQTLGSASREVVNSGVEGAIGKLVNFFRRDPGRLVDRGLGAGELVKAVPGAFKKAARDARGEGQFGSIADVVEGIKRSPDRTDITGSSNGATTRLVKAGTNLATYATEGLKTGEVQRLLRKEGLKAGFRGSDLDTYIAAGSYNPSPEIARKAASVQERVNNINNNPFTNFMRSIGNAAEGSLGKPGKLVKNAILPFPTWLGGNIWNSITDRNVIANGLKAIYNARRDPQYAVEQLAKTITGSAEAFGLGYALASSGVITDTDANGNSYDGLYLHLGDRYIPIQSLGNFAPNLILGYSAYQGFNGESEDTEGVLQNIAQTATETLSKVIPALDVTALTGSGSYLSRGLNQVTNDPDKGFATLASGFAGQFIPALSGDINAFLSNYTGLNPTQEAAETKVADPDSPSGNATDPWPTALNQIKNRIPFISQTLPRAEGEAAPDLIDRVTRGNRDTDLTKEKREAEKTLTDQKKDFSERGIPHYDAKYKDGASFESAVDSKIENGEYDVAVEALRAKLDRDRGNPDIPKSSIKKQEDEIKRIEVTRDGKFEPETIQLYRDTNLTEWRDMGDPDSENYNPEMYQLLWDYDSALANAGVSRNTTSAEKNFYSSKKASSGRGGVSRRVSSNTVGTPQSLGKVNLSRITGQSTGVPRVPKVARLKPSELVKKRKISVSKGV